MKIDKVAQQKWLHAISLLSASIASSFSYRGLCIFTRNCCSSTTTDKTPSNLDIYTYVSFMRSMGLTHSIQVTSFVTKNRFSDRLAFLEEMTADEFGRIEIDRSLWTSETDEKREWITSISVSSIDDCRLGCWAKEMDKTSHADKRLNVFSHLLTKLCFVHSAENSLQVWPKKSVWARVSFTRTPSGRSTPSHYTWSYLLATLSDSIVSGSNSSVKSCFVSSQYLRHVYFCIRRSVLLNTSNVLWQIPWWERTSDEMAELIRCGTVNKTERFPT